MLQGLAQLGGDWKVDMQTCPSGQQVGYLWNSQRVTLSGMKSLWEFNAKAESSEEACKSNRRPGHYAYVEKVGGGTDFHLITVHLKSGPQNKDRKSRKKSLERIPVAVSELIRSDEDLVILGDFNTMGVKDPLLTADAEIEELGELLGAQTPSWRHVAIEPNCTEYYKGEAGWLDHIVVTSNMQEASGVRARVTGYCSVVSCGPLDEQNMPRAYRELSDHCPLVMEISGTEAD